ncbi:unnamed protein product [Durusdinium trenchii]|uniref:Uncharacterized protein n=1 Tax=Durusdinium trenchii TaxID=1381693 RepID=A0ABP0PBS7_9DINO
MPHQKRKGLPLYVAGLSCCFALWTTAIAFTAPTLQQGASAASGAWGVQQRQARNKHIARQALTVDLTGKVAFIAGVADTTGYGWAIARELANAGATIVVGTWPPVLKMFNMALKKKATDEAKKLDDGSLMEIAKIYPLDAMFDVPEDVPDDVKSNKRYAGVEGYTIEECVEAVKKDYGQVDILVHSLANGPEVTKPLLETSRKGYLAASSASAYSLVSMVQRFGPIMPKGGAVISLSYVAAVRTIPGYGGGMSSAKVRSTHPHLEFKHAPAFCVDSHLLRPKAQLESDTRTLAYEAGRKYGIRVNTISAGPLKSRAASAIGGDGEKTFIERAIDYSVDNAPLDQPLYAEDVGRTALCLLTDLTSAVTGMTMYVDMGLHSMGQSLDSPAYEGLDLKSR